MIIMCGMHDNALPQVMHCKSAFVALGYDPIICKGLPQPVSRFDPMQPPKGSGYKSSLTWGAIALPKILWLLERQGAAPSDLFVICEDSCLPTGACAPESLSTMVKPGENLWCGAVRMHKARHIDSVVDASNGSVALSRCSINVMAPDGSKMIVCGIEFLRTWIQMYNISPTAWTVDDHNQVIVASRLLQVNSMFLARNLYPHWSHRTDTWESGENDDHIVQLVSSPEMKVDVVVRAFSDYEAEADGYLSVHAGSDIS